jgi:hypothetical protein
MRKSLLSFLSIILCFAFISANAQESARKVNFKAKQNVVSAPKADVNVVYFEGFENFDPTSAATARVLPAGWGIYRTATLTAEPTTVPTTAFWVCNNPVSNPFAGNPVDPDAWQDYVKTGQGSMIIGYTAPEFTWAITPVIELPDLTGLKLEFWKWYFGDAQYKTNFHLRIFVDGAWVTLQSWVGTPNNEYETPIIYGLDTYKGKNVKFAFVYQYTDGYQMGIDDIKVTAPAPQKYTATFTVVDKDEAPVVGAEIVVNAATPVKTTLTTDASGVATIDLEDGVYEYTITKANYFDAEGSFTVAGEAKAINETLEDLVYDVTFTVIDEKETYTNIKIKGTMYNDWTPVAMIQDPAHTWKVTIPVAPGSYQWGAFEDDGSEWGVWLIEGDNRLFTVTADGTITGDVSYTILAPGDIAVTFIVDITDLIADGLFDAEEDYIDVAGNFNNWGGDAVPFDVDEENSNLYTFTTAATLRLGQELVFKFRKNGDWDLAETPDDPSGKMNRKYIVVAETAPEKIANIYNAVWGENWFNNLGEVEVLEDIMVEVNATVADLNLPATVAVTLGSPGDLTDVVVDLDVTWDTEEFDSSVAGEVTLYGEISLEGVDVTYFNGHALKAMVKVVIGTTNITTKPAFQFSMYPNPTTSYMNVVGVSPINTIRVVNIIGQQVMNISNIGTERYELNTSNLNAGIYIITVTDVNGASISNRFVKR